MGVKDLIHGATKMNRFSLHANVHAFTRFPVQNSVYWPVYVYDLTLSLSVDNND